MPWLLPSRVNQLLQRNKMTNKTNPFNNKNFTWSDGRRWFDQGLILFKKNKNTWYLACFSVAVLMMLVANVSLQLVTFLMVFVSPVLTAFMMNACQKSHKQQPLVWGELLSDLSKKSNVLLVLGAMALLISVFFHYVHIQLLMLFQLPVEITQDMVENMSGQEAFVRAVLNLLTSVPVALALAFSPALVMLKSHTAIEAIKLSFIGVTKAWKAFLVLTLLFILLFFAVLLLVSFVFSILMAVLGPSNQVVMNMILVFFVITVAGIGLCAQYQAFIEIFNNETDKTKEDSAFYTEI